MISNANRLPKAMEKACTSLKGNLPVGARIAHFAECILYYA